MDDGMSSMSANRPRRFRPHQSQLHRLLYCLVALWPGSFTEAAQPAPEIVPTGVVRVEEDWKIVVANPTPKKDSPQLAVVFGPADPVTGIHAVFELNHCTQPKFRKGGMQLQCWRGDQLLNYRGQQRPVKLARDEETISFTTVTEAINDTITLSITNGSSKSFGNFGGNSNLRIVLQVPGANLDSFDGQYSILHSQCEWGNQEVPALCRTAIRYFNADHLLIAEDTTEQFVHRLLD